MKNALRFAALWGSFGLLFGTLALLAQDVESKASGEKKAPAVADLLKNLRARHIGPASMSGRILDLAVDPNRPATIYAASATGGLWKTTNHGTTWSCVFEKEGSSSVGDVEMAPSNPEIIYVGTGEENARNSVSWGNGVYKTMDGGQTWRHLGLEDTHHIGAIAIHPKNPNIVYVAAMGHFWGPNEERGIYKSVDGGVTWQKSKYISADCGFIDLIMDPQQPDTLWAAAYQVRRDAFSGGNPAVMFGEDAGIYKTTDAGATWKRITNGLPQAKAGRIGLDVNRNNPKVLYAVYQTEKTNIRVLAGQPASRTPGDVETGGIFRSEDGGDSWTKVNDLCPRPFYFGKIRVDPTNDQRVFVLGISLFRSEDGGKTFAGNAAPRVHADHHAMWIDPANSEHIILGCDGGVYATWDRGRNWEHMTAIPVSQFYGVAVDMRRPYWVYGGLQDNGSWGGPSQTRISAGIANYDWLRIGGGDGFQCAVDPTDWTCVYAESQYGNLFRLNMATGERRTIRPRHADGKPTRFNWNSPLLISPHNPRTIYYGGNYLFRSLDRGDRWQTISDELTLGPPGSLTTIAESPLEPGLLWTGSDDGKLHLSRDGGSSWIDLTEKLPTPPQRTISRVEASRTKPGAAYVTVDRHRNNDYRPYIFRTSDFGATWEALHEPLPANGSVHLVREDPRNPNLLYCGTEFALFVSLDAGKSWTKVDAGLPTVPVHDLVVHPRDQELVLGTHGRGVWILDVSPLQQLRPEVLAADWHLFEVQPAVNFRRLPAPNFTGARHFLTPNPATGATIYYHLAAAQPGEVRLTIHDALGREMAEVRGPGTAGLHAVNWNLRRRAQTGGRGGAQPRPTAPGPQATAPAGRGGAGGRQPTAPRPVPQVVVSPGDYVVRMTVGEQTQQRAFRVLADEIAPATPEIADDNHDGDHR